MLAMVNKGVKKRGFRVCPDCGRAEPEYGPGFTETKLMKGGAPVQHTSRWSEASSVPGVADGPFYLGHGSRPTSCCCGLGSVLQRGSERRNAGSVEPGCANGSEFAGRGDRLGGVA